MIVVEPVPVHRDRGADPGQLPATDDDAVIAGFRAITDACHAEGAVMVLQLYHVGQHGDFDNSFSPRGRRRGCPRYHDAEGSHAMTEARDRGGRSTASSPPPCGPSAAGFDGVELFAAYHALIDQFWLPWSNRRDDRWGGSLREPHAVRRDDPAAHPQRRAATTSSIGLAVSIDPTTRRGDVARRAVRDRGLARRAPADGLRHVRHRQLLRLRRASSPRTSSPPSSGCRAAAPARGGAPRQGCRPRATSAPPTTPKQVVAAGARRHGQHRPRPDRRSTPGREGPDGPG